MLHLYSVCNLSVTAPFISMIGVYNMVDKREKNLNIHSVCATSHLLPYILIF